MGLAGETPGTPTTPTTGLHGTGTLLIICFEKALNDVLLLKSY